MADASVSCFPTGTLDSVRRIISHRQDMLDKVEEEGQEAGQVTEEELEG